jgi:hypothetical protein
LSEPCRLIVVHKADPSGRYAWLPRLRPGDVTVSLDALADEDLADRQPIPFDQLQSWEQRSAAELGLTELLAAIAAHRAVAAIEYRRSGFRLIDFAELRLRSEIARLLQGWTLARAVAGAGELVCDPATAPAFAIGVRAGLGFDPSVASYTLSPALAGSRRRRAFAREATRVLAVASRPERVRVAVVAAGKLALALASLTGADLRAAGVGLMPFPGLDHGNGLLLALRRRLPILRTYGPARVGAGMALHLPERLGVEADAVLDRALTLLVGRMLAAAAGELEQAVRALDGMEDARSLRALLLPTAAYGASRVLIDWAHRRGLRVGAMQHGIYSFREGDFSDRWADMLVGWGPGSVDQIVGWTAPRPAVRVVGVPGITGVVRAETGIEGLPARAVNTPLRSALIVTTGSFDTPLLPTDSCEAFIDAIVPGLRRLAAAGVEIQLRPHPWEQPERYRRLLGSRGLDIGIARRGPVANAVLGADILIAAGSSVAFEAAALEVPVLLWQGQAPRWVRERHLVAPWTDDLPGMFVQAKDFTALIDRLLAQPDEGMRIARQLSRKLAHYAQPFSAAGFAAALHELGAQR